MAYHIISESDLMRIEAYRKAKEENNKREELRVLYLNGVDITKPFTYEECTHRNLMNEVVEGKRITSTERSDEGWLVSGAASAQAKAEARGDGSFLRELNSIRTTGICSAEGMFNSKDYDIESDAGEDCI